MAAIHLLLKARWIFFIIHLISDEACMADNLFGTKDPSCSLWGVNSSWLCAFSFWLPQQAQAPASPPATGYHPAPEQRQPPRFCPALSPRGKAPPGRSPVRFTHPPRLHIPAISAPRTNKAAKGGRRLYLLLRISVVMRDSWRRFFAVTWSAFPPKIMKPLSTKELPPSHGLPAPARGELNPAASAP